eukprot:scaffold10828_cov143-Isochrysis_galbana.AAC.1
MTAEAASERWPPRVHAGARVGRSMCDRRCPVHNSCAPVCCVCTSDPRAHVLVSIASQREFSEAIV